jgi:2-methylcitrate dehydratase PrpD
MPSASPGHCVVGCSNSPRGDGGMVKRLHLGRASEAGVLAASLAADGFEGPRTVLEGEFGFLKVFCTKWDEAKLTRGLSEEFVVSSTVLKRYPCHATAHAAVRAVRELQAAHGFKGAEVETITVTGTERMIERHNILEPADLMLAQYSIPFCVALALCTARRGTPNPSTRPHSATLRFAPSAVASGWCRSHAGSTPGWEVRS